MTLLSYPLFVMLIQVLVEEVAYSDLEFPCLVIVVTVVVRLG